MQTGANIGSMPVFSFGVIAMEANDFKALSPSMGRCQPFGLAKMFVGSVLKYPDIEGVEVASL